MTEATTPQISTTTLPARTPRVVIPAGRPTAPAELPDQSLEAQTAVSPEAVDKVLEQTPPPEGPQVVAAPPVVEAPPKPKRTRKPKAEKKTDAKVEGFGFERRVVVESPPYSLSDASTVTAVADDSEPIKLASIGRVGFELTVDELRELVKWGTAYLAHVDGG